MSSLIRSELSVPAGNTRMVEKALASDADAFFLDLEDSVAPESKDGARAAAITTLRTVDWGKRDRSVRINAIGTPWVLRDIVDLVQSQSVDRIVAPKIRNAGDVAFLDRVIDSAARASGTDSAAIQLEVQIEDAHGLHNLDAILAESSRVTVVTFGQGDFAAAVGMPADEIGMTDEWDRAVRGDRWLLPRQHIVLAASRRSIPALNGPFAAYRDNEGFRAYCRMSRSLGFSGVWCIHPAQIEIANDVFSPTDAELSRAQSVIAAMTSGRNEGSGAVARENVMTDEANVRMAQRVIDLAQAIAGQNKTGTHR